MEMSEGGIVSSVGGLPFVLCFLDPQPPLFPPAAETTHKGVSEKSLIHTLVNSLMKECRVVCNLPPTPVPLGSCKTQNTTFLNNWGNTDLNLVKVYCIMF